MADKDELPSLKELDRSIQEAKKRALGDDNQESNPSSGIMRVSIDLLSGVIVGSVSGFYIDKWLGTSPVFFLVCFALGVAGSGLNIYRSVKNNNTKE